MKFKLSTLAATAAACDDRIYGEVGADTIGHGGTSGDRITGDTRFDLTDPSQWPDREDEIRTTPASSNLPAGN